MVGGEPGHRGVVAVDPGEEMQCGVWSSLENPVPRLNSLPALPRRMQPQELVREPGPGPFATSTMMTRRLASWSRLIGPPSLLRFGSPEGRPGAINGVAIKHPQKPRPRLTTAPPHAGRRCTARGVAPSPPSMIRARRVRRGRVWPPPAARQILIAPGDRRRLSAMRTAR